MIKQTTLGLLGLALAIVAPMTYAELEPYIGAGWGEYKLEFDGNDNLDSDFDDDQDFWRVFGGLQINDVLGVEVAYYEFDDADDRSGTDGLEAQLDGASIAAIFSAPLHDRFSLFAKVGWFWWEADISRTQTVIPGVDPLREDFDGNDVFFGAGLNFGLTESLEVRLEYDRFELDEDVNPDLDAASISLQWKF